MVSKYKICVCKGKSCTANFSRDTKEAFECLVQKKGLSKDILVADGGCYGRCTKGPNVLVIGPISEEEFSTYREQNLMPGPDGPKTQMYNEVTANDCRELFEQHCIANKLFEPLAEKETCDFTQPFGRKGESSHE
ncbi:MAG: hypothetical protein A3I05_01865 [Deltaproteobacteria bacterium RIFCSPLOWO2_02_FULL_44_10]|nr:MAG: hypothetical protein A3C46_04845 [Deltaproteobacteria bacterium RIFCSPHIGHO2_02_FULL_44_16]OGQ44956.1 MAG: hypothetical protein A3I05_01865 [Deltaproteobacteria bacterium RIFCSPLOWO2_02_FULL_44_10]